jgi:galactonate dehydratase
MSIVQPDPLNAKREARTTSMKIRAVKTYIVPPRLSVTAWGPGNPWVLVRLETDSGIVGWGQAYTFRDREQAIALATHKLASILDGLDPFDIKGFIAMALGSITGPDGGSETAAAVAGIEIALWDIVGKAQDSPVHQLLGRACRDRVGVYANCWSDVLRSPEELATFALEQVNQGFKAVKVYPFLYDNTVDEGIACLAAVREAVGPDVSLFVDMWSKVRDEDLPLIIDALHAQRVTWFEDPADATEVEALALIRRQSQLPVISGETLYLSQDFRRLLEHKAADSLNPDVTLCGMLGIKEIATMADAFSVSVSVHNNNTMTIGLAAALHIAAVIPNVRLVEYFPRFVAGSNAFSTFPTEMDEEGCILLPNDPGIGVTVDEAAVEAMEYKPGLGQL